MRFGIAIGLLATVQFIAAQQTDRAAERLLESAIHEEMVVGNLPGALEQYKAALAQSGTNRTVAARALFHIGQCQERLGQRADAHGTYTRVAKEYSDQVEIMALVQPKLANWKDAPEGPYVSFRTAVPGWYLAGNDPRSFEISLDREEKHGGLQSATIRCLSRSSGFGTLMQDFRADQYRGRRVRLSAWVMAEAAALANIWMRVDGMDTTVGFDNMDSRPMRGSFPWRKQEIVLDVPESAAAIYCGLRLRESGQAWIDDIVLEVVNKKVRSTGAYPVGGKSALVYPAERKALASKPGQPVNPDFEQ